MKKSDHSGGILGSKQVKTLSSLLFFFLSLALLLAALHPYPSFAAEVSGVAEVLGIADAPESQPLVSLQIGDGSTKQLSTGIQILILMTILSLAPALFIMMSSFVRIVVVLSFLRQAMGTMQSPPNQVIISLALFLTFFVMAPVWQKVNETAIQPYLAEEITQTEALGYAVNPIRKFMLNQIREQDLAMFLEMTDNPTPESVDDVATHVIISAFMISELRTAFQIGFLVYLPFLVIDMVVASTLMSMGMMMLPPIMVSLPFKLILFVLADGWHLVVGSLMRSFV